MLTVLGIIPWAIVGVVLGTAGVGIGHWQFWAVLVSMLVSDVISWLKGKYDI